jgi:proteic killer suppression protein
MIASFRSKALQRLWERNDASGLRPDWVAKVARRLDALELAVEPSDLDLPGFGFHALTGDLRGRYALVVSRNWRMTFSMVDGEILDLDLEDYHN